MTRIKAVVLDYGNVVSLCPEPADFDRLQAMTELDEETFGRLYWLYRDDYDRGILDGAEYWTRIGATAGKNLARAEIQSLIEEDIALWTRINGSIITWARALRENGLNTGILSNMPVDISSYLRNSAGWLEDFDCALFSCELGVIKPDPAIYDACLKQLEVEPEQALFIDDRPVNVEGARLAGMHALTFGWHGDRIAFANILASRRRRLALSNLTVIFMLIYAPARLKQLRAPRRNTRTALHSTLC
jgi:putative hydrolase of the HAD superfamily